MCNISKGVREDGLAEGMEKGCIQERIEAIRNLMRNMKLTSEQAMEALSVPKSEYSKYEDMLKEYMPRV